jgi:hypothetical protein
MASLNTINHIRQNILYYFLFIILMMTIVITYYLQTNGTAVSFKDYTKTNNEIVSSHIRTELNTLTSTLTRLVARLDKIEEQQNLIQHTRISSSETQSQITGYVNNQDSIDNTSTQEWMQNSDEFEQNSIEIYDLTLQQEQPDDEWNMQMDTQIKIMLAELSNSDTVIEEIDCRTTTCKIELAHPQGSGQFDFLDSISTSEVFRGEFYAQPTTNDLGEDVTVVYFSKPDAEIFVD